MLKGVAAPRRRPGCDEHERRAAAADPHNRALLREGSGRGRDGPGRARAGRLGAPRRRAEDRLPRPHPHAGHHRARLPPERHRASGRLRGGTPGARDRARGRGARVPPRRGDADQGSGLQRRAPMRRSCAT